MKREVRLRKERLTRRREDAKKGKGNPSSNPSRSSRLRVRNSLRHAQKFVVGSTEITEFTEVDLRRMLEKATGHRRDTVARRWIIETRHSRREWEVVLEPLMTEQLVLVVTAYPVENA
jgi:hypothetical protein